MFLVILFFVKKIYAFQVFILFILGEDVLEVIVVRELKYGASRFAISLNGVDENISLSSRMPLSSYTFPNRVNKIFLAHLLNLAKTSSKYWSSSN